MNKQVLIGLSTLSLVTILSGIALSSSNSSAASASTATAAVKIAASCTLTSTGGGNYSATVPNGTSAEIPGSSLSVSCNDAGGFALYAVGYSNDTIGNNNMIGASTNIATGTSGNNSYWAMKVNPVSGNTPTIENSFDSFHNVPDTLTKVASYNQFASSGSLAVNATYKASISSTQLAGNYLGKVKYTLVYPSTADPGRQEVACGARKICYNANITQAVGQMGEQTAYSNTSVTLWASNFSRTGYGFAGWSDAFDYYGKYYGPNETITTPSDMSTNGLSLYAIWIPSAGTLQSWNGCSGLAQGAVTALTDSRDNNTYAVAKLADGKCWMIENLRLDNTASHNSDGSLAQGYNPSFIGLANSESVFDASGVANSLYSTDGSTAAPAITGSDTGHRFPRYNNFNTQSRQSSSSYSIGNYTYSYGNYYTWHAAIADTTYYNTNNQSITSTSICPTGWRLPKGGNKSNEANNEFWDLIVNGLNKGVKPANYDSETNPYYTGTAEARPISDALRSYPNNFLYSGWGTDPVANYRGSHARYWSSTVTNRIDSYKLEIGDNGIHLTSSDKRYLGNSIRCIFGS